MRTVIALILAFSMFFLAPMVLPVERMSVAQLTATIVICSALTAGIAFFALLKYTKGNRKHPVESE